MERRVLERILAVSVILLAVSISVMIYLSNLKAVSFDYGFYEKEYDKLGRWSEFPESVDLKNETRFLILYLEHGEGTIDTDFFNEKEKSHLVDVRQLFKTAELALDISFVISVFALAGLAYLIMLLAAYMSHKEVMSNIHLLLARILTMTGFITTGIGAFFIFVAMTFSTSFIRFHELLFDNENWLLDPLTDNLIRMFPEQFFFDLFVRILIFSIGSATILLIVGFLIKLGKPKKI